jgi:hypothetical protein
MYVFKTSRGPFAIVPRHGRWRAMFGDEDLGAYISPEQAADDLADGHTFTPSCGDTGHLGLSRDLSDWEWIDLGGN